MSRLRYLIYRFASDMVSLLSRLVNAVVFKGSTAQTLSSRSYIDGRTDPKWERIGRFINWLFFWQEDHIKQAWEAEVERARYTLQRLEGLR